MLEHNKKIEVSKEKKDDMIRSIKEFFRKERDEEIGDLAAAIYLDFIIEQLASEFYNQGVFDSYKYLNDRILDMLELQK